MSWWWRCSCAGALGHRGTGTLPWPRVSGIREGRRNRTPVLRGARAWGQPGASWGRPLHSSWGRRLLIGWLLIDDSLVISPNGAEPGADPALECLIIDRWGCRG